MDYRNYDRGYAEPTMSASDYMTRTYRWMACGLLITFAMAYLTATTSLIYLVDSLYFLLTIGELALVFMLSARVQRMSIDGARAAFFGYAILNGMVLSYYFLMFSVGTLVMAFLATAVYFALHLTEITTRMRYIDDVTPAAKFFAAATVLLVLEITRRTTGWALVIVASTLILYAFFGDMLPRAVKHTGFTFDVIVEHLFLLNEGVYGIPIGVATSTLFGFIMFGAFLERSKMSSIFMDLACLLPWCGRPPRTPRGGPAKVAIFASALFGTISGSAAANVYGTGTFTIPLMKKVGYRAPFAGAVEAVASTGGQLMPPIMGATAFVMADVTGAGYLAVAKAALLPSLLYYFSLLMMIHFEAVNKNIGIIPADQIPDPCSVLRRTYHILPIIVLIGLLVSGRSVISSAFISIASVIVVSCFSAETRFTPKSLYHTLELSSRNALMISTCSACAGIIVAIVSITSSSASSPIWGSSTSCCC